MFKRIALLFAVLVAGCAQEGKLIDVPLTVQAVAFDEQAISDTSTTAIFFTTRFKIQVHAGNPCERRHVLLELSRIGSTLNPSYVIKPVARYNADDACVSEPAGVSDTTVVLTINSVTIPNAGTIPMVIGNATGPVFLVGVDSTMHVPVPQTMIFRVRVEDKVGASRIPGATVQLDSLSVVGGGVGPIGSQVTDSLGVATFNVSSSVPVGVDAFRYQVTVTSGATTVVVPVRDGPARGQSIERVFVRI